MTQRNIYFLLFSLVWLALFYAPLRGLAALAARSELYSHTLLIPLVSGYLLYAERKKIFPDARYAFLAGGAAVAAGALLYLFGTRQASALNPGDYLSAMTSSAVVCLIGGFVALYGTRSFRAAAFPLLFLAFVVPAPAVIMDRIISFLQAGSAEATYVVFKALGIPFVREGFVFSLPGITIEVAQECSGIRSSIVLFIVGVLSSFLFLRTGWRRSVLLASIVPLAVIKNGIRIVTLSLLGLYVDEAFVGGSDLHRKGGFVFFLVALSLFMLLLWVLRRSERKARGPA